MAGNHTFDSSNTRHNVARMLEALATPMTYLELEAKLHMSHRSVQLYLWHLRNEPRRVRISGYRMIDSRWQKVFGLGSGPDAPAPKKQSEKKRNALYRAKVKADPELRLKATLREKAKWAAKKATAKPQSWLSALM